MPAREVLGPRGTLLALALITGVLALPGLAWWPLGVVLPGSFWGAMLQGERARRRRIRERAGESICTFARSFARRAVDP